MNIPPQYNRLMPYLIVNGGYDFIAFMQKVFGAVEQVVVPRAEGIVMHGELRIGDGVIMFADSTPENPPRPSGIYIYVEQVDHTFQSAIASGALETMPPQQQPYGYTCGFRDPFGNDWWPVQS